jgi:ATP-dependent protease HslVU (ClpYQ) ATPase subunit
MNLAEWGADASERDIQNIASRGLHMTCEEIRDILSKMGESMSMRKLHRKIAIMAVVLSLERGETINNHQILDEASRHVRNCSAITIDMVGAIMRIIEKWGYVQSHKSITGGWPQNVYRRTDLV